MRNPLHSARGRTITGLSLAVLFVPLMLGITACLDTPIGDPEQGWVDPRVTGVWMAAEGDGDGFGDTAIWVLEPYDARTWLVTWMSITNNEPELPGDPEGPDATSVDPEAAGGTDGGDAAAEKDEPDQPPLRLTADQVDAVVAALESDELKGDELIVFKAWLTSIGKSRYLVLEPKHVLDSERGFSPDAWWVFRLVLRDGAMQLSLVSLPEGVKTRGEAESILAARPDDPDLFEPYVNMAPVPQRHYDVIAQALSSATTSPID